MACVKRIKQRSLSSSPSGESAYMRKRKELIVLARLLIKLALACDAIASTAMILVLANETMRLNQDRNARHWKIKDWLISF